MDQSTPAVTGTENQPAQANNSGQAPLSNLQLGSLRQLASSGNTQPVQTGQSISGHPEFGSIQSAANQDTAEDNGDFVKRANQETDMPNPSQQAAEVQKIELKPQVPEITIDKSVENIIEKSFDTQTPKLPQQLKDAGVTISGPGIPIEENSFAIKTMPITYQQAELEEKTTKLKDSKHWLAELIMYVWRKIDPDINKKTTKN